MRFFTIIITVTVFVFAASCIKSKNDLCKYGTVRFTCNGNNPYMIFVDGGTSIDLVQPKEYKDVKVYKGKHTLKAEQKSGYIIFPTVKTMDVDIQGCDTLAFMFP
ncbi:MAG: hypothetical protein JST82_15765 [Bacteroidetes bacterium]|nr:hypothetical protein [Bacteroidota bacterium]